MRLNTSRVMHNHIFRLLIWKISVMFVSTFMCPRGLHNSLLPDPDNCSGYFHCISGGRYYHKTCSFGLRFDPRHKICNWPSLVPCKVASRQTRKMSSDMRMESEKETFQDPFEMKPYMLLSDIERRRSWKNELNRHEFRKAEMEGSGDDIRAVPFADKNGDFLNKRTYKDPVLNRSTVKCDRAFSFLTDPLRCDVFYQCHMWIPYPKVCPQGLYFDESTFVCNWPHLLNCVNGRRKPLFEQLPLDPEVNTNNKMQNPLIHERKTLQGKTRNRNPLRTLQANMELNSVRKSLHRRKTSQDNYFHSTSSFSAANIHPSASWLSKDKRHKSVRDAIKVTHAFNKRILDDLELTGRRRMNIRKIGLKSNRTKENLGRIAVSQKNMSFSSTIASGGSVYHPRSLLDQLKENPINNTTENETLPVNFELRENIFNASLSNGSDIQNERKGFPKTWKINFTVQSFESEENKTDDLRVLNQQKIEEFKDSTNQSSPNDDRFISFSPMIANNFTPEKKNHCQDEYQLKCINGSNYIEEDKQILVNNKNISSLIDNFPNSNNLTFRTDLKECNTSVNNCGNKTFVNETLLIISTKTSTNEAPTTKMILDSSNINESTFNSVNTNEIIINFDLSVKTTESTNSSRNAENLLKLSGDGNFKDTVFPSNIQANMSESYDELMNKKNFNETKTDEEIRSKEKLNQQFTVLEKESKPTENVNLFADSNSAPFTTENPEVTVLDANSEVRHHRKQRRISAFPNESILNWKETNEISKIYFTPINRNTYVDLLNSTVAPLHRKSNINTSIRPLNNNFLINSSIIKPPEKLIMDHNNEKIADSIKNETPLRNTTEQHNDVLQFNNTYIEHEISSSMLFTIAESKDVNVTAKNQHNKKEEKSSSDLTDTTSPLIAIHSAMETFNDKEYVECCNVTRSRRQDPIPAEDAKAIHGTESEIKTIKPIDKRNRDKKINFSTFSIQKTKGKHHGAFKQFLYRKLVELFSLFVPKHINTTKIWSPLNNMTTALVNPTNESELRNEENYTKNISSPIRILKGSSEKIKLTEKTIRPNESKEIFFSEINDRGKVTARSREIGPQNGSKVVVNENMFGENSSERFNNTNKMTDHSKINISPVPLEISHVFKESINDTETIYQEYITSSTEMESINGKVGGVNFHPDENNKLDGELMRNIKTNEPKITTKTAKFKTNRKTFKENGSEEINPEAGNINENVNTKNKTIQYFFYDKTSLDYNISTTNEPISNLSHENGRYPENDENSDVLNIEFLQSNETHINTSRTSQDNWNGLEEITIKEHQSVSSNASKLENLKENEEHGREKVKNRKEITQNVTVKTTNIFSVSVNTTEFLVTKWGNISNNYNKKKMNSSFKEHQD